MPVHHQNPQPRVVFQAVPNEVYESLSPLVASATVAHGPDGVHQSEVDLVVTFASDVSLWDKHLPVLSFGAFELGQTKVPGAVASQPTSATLILDHDTNASEMREPDGLDPNVRALVVNDLVPRLALQDQKITWKLRGSGPSGHQGDLRGTCVPLLHLGPEKFVPALEYMRSEGALCLALPECAADYVGWLRYMISRLRTLRPSAFPSDPDWALNPDWASPDVRAAVLAKEQVDEERKQSELDFAARTAAAEAEIATHLAQPTGAIASLTESGDELVDAVIGILNDLGFNAEDMDDSHVSSTGKRLEDIRVKEPGDTEWLCLGEVKGYEKGTKTNDVSQITGQPCVHLALTEQRSPSTVWFISNHWRSTDPDTRPAAFPNPALDLSPVVDFDGAGFDTRDLYRAWRDVQIGVAEVDDVRASLKSARGLWSWVSPTPTD